MGFAIIWVFIFHSGPKGNFVYDIIQEYGFGGVDIFIFLSAIGLCYSINKDSRLLQFYKRRVLRILPTWIFVLFVVHILGLVSAHFKPDTNFGFPHTFFQCVTWYTGIGFYVSNLFSMPNPLNYYYYEWYVPTLLLLYLLFPLLHKQSNFKLILVVILTMIFGWIGYGMELPDGTLWFCYQRFPIFIVGILYYRMMHVTTCVFQCKMLILSFVLFISTILVEILDPGRIPIIYSFLFLTPPLCVLLSFLMKNQSVYDVLSFFGTISLELYLIHIYSRPLYIVGVFVKNQYLAVLVTFLLCSLAAWLLHLFINHVVHSIRLSKHSI